MTGSQINRQNCSLFALHRTTSVLWACIFGVVCALNFYGSAWGTPSKPVNEPGVLRETLSNGLRVIIVQNPLAPVVTTVVNYRVGADETPPGFPGMAHALEHMMFRGSPGLSGDQLDEIGAMLGGNFDAQTQQGVTQYFFTTPVEDLDLALHIEALQMRGIVTDENLWHKERGAIQQEVAQDLSDPEYVFYTKLLQVMFKGTPYEQDALGTRQSFDKTTTTDLRKFHDEWYRPNNAILIVAGDVSLEPTLKNIKKLFENIPAGALPPRPDYTFQPVKPQQLSVETDSPYGTVTFAFRFPGFDSSDYAAAVVLADVLSSRRGRFYGLVPNGQALFAAFSYDALRNSGIGSATADFPAGANPEDLLRRMRTILSAETTNGFPTELVEAAKRYEIASAEFQRNSVSDLAMEWSSAVAIEGRISPQEDVDAIRRVSVADVNRAAVKYLNMNHAVTGILTPRPSGKTVSTKSFGEKESFAPSEIKSVKLPDWAESAVNRLEIPKLTAKPIITNLSNGLKLIVQPESVSNTVCVYGHVKNQPKIEMSKGKDGVDRVLEELFTFGTQSLNRLAFEKALDEIGATEAAGADFSLQVLTKDFDRGMKLLADNEISPALPEKAFDLIQPELAAEVAGELASPGHQVKRALKTALFPTDDPIRRETTPATVKSLSMQDVADYYHHAFRPDLTTMVIIGNVKPEQAIAVASKYFGGWKASGPKPDTLFPPAAANAPAMLNVPDASRVQDDVVLAHTLELTRNNTDYYALDLANQILGGVGYDTRLYRDLRTERGLVYFVSSDVQLDLSRGIYEVNYACDPSNVFKARRIITRDINEMRTKPVGDSELRQAKVLLLRQIPLSESSFEQIAQAWLARSELNLPLDEPVRAARRYLRLSAADIRAAFAKWLRPQDFVQVSQGPSPQ